MACCRHKLKNNDILKLFSLLSPFFLVKYICLTATMVNHCRPRGPVRIHDRGLLETTNKQFKLFINMVAMDIHPTCRESTTNDDLNLLESQLLAMLDLRKSPLIVNFILEQRAFKIVIGFLKILLSLSPSVLGRFIFHVNIYIIGRDKRLFLKLFMYLSEYIMYKCINNCDH